MIIKALNCSTILDDNSDERTESVSPLIYKIFSHQITISHASKRSTSSKQQQQQQREEEEEEHTSSMQECMHVGMLSVMSVLSSVSHLFVIAASQSASLMDFESISSTSTLLCSNQRAPVQLSCKI